MAVSGGVGGQIRRISSCVSVVTSSTPKCCAIHPISFTICCSSGTCKNDRSETTVLHSGHFPLEPFEISLAPARKDCAMQVEQNMWVQGRRTGSNTRSRQIEQASSRLALRRRCVASPNSFLSSEGFCCCCCLSVSECNFFIFVVVVVTLLPKKVCVQVFYVYFFLSERNVKEKV